MVQLLPSHWKSGCSFFLMHKTEHKQHAVSSGGPREGGKLRPTTELGAFNTSAFLNSRQQLQMLFIYTEMNISAAKFREWHRRKKKGCL